MVDGLPLFQGVQLAVDTTLVCPLDKRGCSKATQCGCERCVPPGRRKEMRYPELAGDGGSARLVVLTGEVAGRFSGETASFLRGLAAAKVRGVPELLQGRARAAWLRRWGSMLACAAARAFALSLLDRDCSAGVDGPTSSVHGVLGDSRHLL